MTIMFPGHMTDGCVMLCLSPAGIVSQSDMTDYKPMDDGVASGWSGAEPQAVAALGRAALGGTLCFPVRPAFSARAAEPRLGKQQPGARPIQPRCLIRGATGR
jgi:hypothetical protein